MNTEYARIASLGSPNNNFLYIDFLEPFSFPPFYVSEKTGALHDMAQSPGSAPLLLFSILFFCRDCPESADALLLSPGSLPTSTGPRGHSLSQAP